MLGIKARSSGRAPGALKSTESSLPPQTQVAMIAWSALHQPAPSSLIPSSLNLLVFAGSLREGSELPLKELPLKRQMTSLSPVSPRDRPRPAVLSPGPDIVPWWDSGDHNCFPSLNIGVPRPRPLHHPANQNPSESPHTQCQYSLPLPP